MKYLPVISNPRIRISRQKKHLCSLSANATKNKSMRGPPLSLEPLSLTWASKRAVACLTRSYSLIGFPVSRTVVNAETSHFLFMSCSKNRCQNPHVAKHTTTLYLFPPIYRYLNANHFPIMGDSGHL